MANDMISQPAENMQIDEIEELFGFISQGTNAWIKAGELLCVMVKRDPQVYTKILSRHPMLTREILHSFERIGRREVYPPLLLDASPGAVKLAALPYDEQVRLYEGKVQCMVPFRGTLEVREKRVSDLSSAEALRVFDGNHVRAPAEQAAILRARISSGPSRSHEPSGVHSSLPVPAVFSDVQSTTDGQSESDIKTEAADWNNDPRAELVRLLHRAKSNLLEARAMLTRIRPHSPQDAHITKSLREIGKFLFDLNDNPQLP